MKSVTLRSGAVMPLNGFGTSRLTTEETETATLAALAAGYHHIDCAAVYMNEKEVGRAFGKHFGRNDVKRSDVFITSKVWNTCHKKDDVVKACRQTLDDLRLDYLDLYLVHHPFSWEFIGLPITKKTYIPRCERTGQLKMGGASLLETWCGMEECQRLGLVRDIGVSNYSVALMADVMNYAEILPSVNQCECHVYNTRVELRSVCDMYNIHLTMYSILGSGKEGLLDDEVVALIAKSHGATSAQVMIAWGLSKHCAVLSKSAKAKRMAENLKSENISFSDEEIAKLDALDRKQMVINMANFWGGFPSHA